MMLPPPTPPPSSRRAAALLLGLLATLASGCATVAPYQRQYLNDEDMKLAGRRVEGFETNFESYREGVGGANGGKAGGGCGCN